MYLITNAIVPLTLKKYPFQCRPHNIIIQFRIHVRCIMVCLFKGFMVMCKCFNMQKKGSMIIMLTS